jgi:hypothetical protein
LVYDEESNVIPKKKHQDLIFEEENLEILKFSTGKYCEKIEWISSGLLYNNDKRLHLF